MTNIQSKLARCAAERVRKGWTQGYFARDAKGNQVSSNSSMAVSFCALGAISRCAQELSIAHTAAHWEVEAALSEAAATNYGHSVAIWNDMEGRTAEEVAAALEVVADELSKEET